MTPIRIAVAGAGGRMGRSVLRAIAQSGDCELAGALEIAGHPCLGRPASVLSGSAANDVRLTNDASEALAHADAAIDFTAPEVSAALANRAAELCVADVIGATGFTPEQESQIATAARKIAIVKSGNFSRGATLLANLVRKAANALPDFDVEIVEMHHRLKRDAPSGTARLLGEAVAAARNISLDEKAAFERAGRSRLRQDGEIGFASLRGGTVAGEHQAIFAGEHERVVLSHVAEDRMIFALGALAAARWALGKPAGLYAMTDVLGLTADASKRPP